MRILKFPMPPIGEQRVYLTKGARPLSVGWQGEQLVCWVETVTTKRADDTELWLFTIAMTGDPVPEAEYVGTAQLPDGLGSGQPYVVHVYGHRQP